MIASIILMMLVLETISPNDNKQLEDHDDLMSGPSVQQLQSNNLWVTELSTEATDI